MRYRHKDGVRCGCKTRSVLGETLEADFIVLIRLMTIDNDMIGHLTEFAIQADKARGIITEDTMEIKKQEAIALCRRRINAAVVLFDEGRIDVEGYRDRIEKNEREIAYWQSRTTESEKVAFELARCVEAVSEITQLGQLPSQRHANNLPKIYSTIWSTTLIHNGW